MPSGHLHAQATSINEVLSPYARAGSYDPNSLVSNLVAAGSLVAVPSSAGSRVPSIAAKTATKPLLGSPAGQAGVKALHGGPVPITDPSRLLPAPRALGNPNTSATYEKIVVDLKGNAVPLKPGEYITGSPDGCFIQVRDAFGNPTGLRIDGPHKPASHPDPRAQAPHAHVPEVTNLDGTPWLPVNQ